MIVDFINWCLQHNYPYEQGKNWCDCVDYTTFINFWVDGKVHTFYALDNGAFKLDNAIVNDINDVERVLGLLYEKQD